MILFKNYIIQQISKSHLQIAMILTEHIHAPQKMNIYILDTWRASR